MNLADVTSAAHLLRHALQPRQRPTLESEYRELLDRYRTDTPFAELVERVADGLGIDVRQPTALGLIVSGRTDGPFAVTVDGSGLPVRKGTGRLQDRRLFGLVLVAVAAFAYPNGEALVEASTPALRAADVEGFLTARCAALAELADEGADDDGQLGMAAIAWLDLESILPNERGGLKNECRRSYVQRTLDFLVRSGRARHEPSLDDERGPAYLLNDRFRIGIAETVESAAFAILVRPSTEETG
jgi:hypothetical protein